MTGPSPRIDPRRDAVRADLADVDLAARVFAPHYAQGAAYVVTREAELRLAPKPDAEALVALTQGSEFAVFDLSAGWAWGRAGGMVGYVPLDAVAPA